MHQQSMPPHKLYLVLIQIIQDFTNVTMLVTILTHLDETLIDI